jgi:hypothetical protein
MPMDVFWQFVEIIEEIPVEMANQNISRLTQLYSEFGLQKSSPKLSILSEISSIQRFCDC